MPYICKDCGNKTAFRGYEVGTCDYWSRTLLDENIEVVDNYDTDYDNYIMSGIEDIECSECDSTNVENVSESEWAAHEYEPEDKKEEIPKNDFEF